MGREEILAKAEKRGYSVIAFSSDKSWYSLYHDFFGINLELYPDTEEFVFNYRIDRSILRLTTDKCGSFMNDEHFKRIEKQTVGTIFNLR
jgi:hypothetical protein